MEFGLTIIECDANYDMNDNEIVLIISRIAREIRGQIINIFTNTEVLIDDIIRKTTFENEYQYDTYMEILQKGDLTMNVKKKLLKMCIHKFEKKYTLDLSILKNQIDNVIDKRNNLAHWVVDTTVEGVSLFREKNKIRLISFDKNRKKLEVYFDQTSAAALEKSIYEVTTQLIQMQKHIDIEIQS